MNMYTMSTIRGQSGKSLKNYKTDVLIYWLDNNKLFIVYFWDLGKFYKLGLKTNYGKNLK